MILSGINTLTLLDYPDKVASIVFTAGCPFRCGYCHNPQFVLPDQIQKLMPAMIPEEKFFKFLESRVGLLDAIVVSGGEPTIHPDLPDFFRKIKDMGFLTKLDTNGTNPDMVQKLINEKLIDFVAMDIKATPEKYEKTVSAQVNTDDLIRTKELIMNSNIDHEFRTTVIQEFHTESDIKEIAQLAKGCHLYSIQNFRPAKTLDQNFSQYHPCTKDQLETFKHIAEQYIENVRILD